MYGAWQFAVTFLFYSTLSRYFEKGFRQLIVQLQCKVSGSLLLAHGDLILPFIPSFMLCPVF